jgi:hypothetical protein
MNKIIKIGILSLILSTILVGCGSDSDNDSENSNSTDIKNISQESSIFISILAIINNIK